MTAAASQRRSEALSTFAEWFRRQGHHVLETASTCWLDMAPRCYQAFPYHWLIHPSEQELQILLRGHRALSLRYSTSLQAAAGRLSYHMTYEKPSYGLEDLGKWARKNVRRGLKNCSVEPIEMKRLAEEGWTLQEDTLNRQNRTSNMSPDSWRTLCLAGADLPGFDAWGAIVSGQLAATVMTFQLDDCAYMLYQQCRREYLTAHVNNALSFAVTQKMLCRDGVRSVFYSLDSLDAQSTMDQFKLRMGYSAKPVRQRVVFHPWCSPFINRFSHGVVKSLLTLSPSQKILAKGEGMMRFYLDGQRPIEAQTPPAALQGTFDAKEE